MGCPPCRQAAILADKPQFKEQSVGNTERIRQVYESAIANLRPPAEEKRYWQQYAYLTLYEKYLEWAPESCCAWSKYAELEISLRETDGARAIFELAIAQTALDMPELLWKAYIDFEVSQGEYERTRQLYERLLDRTKHLKVWISSLPEATAAMNLHSEQMKQFLLRARSVFENAINYFRISAPESKEERALLLESSFGSIGDVSLLENKFPKKRREIISEDEPTTYEEYYD